MSDSQEQSTVTIFFSCADHPEDLSILHDVPKQRLIGSFDDGLQLRCHVCDALVGAVFAPSLEDLEAEIEGGELFYNIDSDRIERERRKAPWFDDES